VSEEMGVKEKSKYFSFVIASDTQGLIIKHFGITSFYNN
jgi:hypothetical protein